MLCGQKDRVCFQRWTIFTSTFECLSNGCGVAVVICGRNSSIIYCKYYKILSRLVFMVYLFMRCDALLISILTFSTTSSAFKIMYNFIGDGQRNASYSCICVNVINCSYAKFIFLSFSRTQTRLLRPFCCAPLHLTHKIINYISYYFFLLFNLFYKYPLNNYHLPISLVFLLKNNFFFNFFPFILL